MAHYYRFRCAGCGYAARVCGGDASGFHRRLATMWCLGCRELRDVPIEFRERDFLNDGEQLDADEKNLGRCPRCGGHDLAPWAAGEPCPRCRGKMTNEGVEGDWD